MSTIACTPVLDRLQWRHEGWRARAERGADAMGASSEGRRCPWCGSTDVELVQRGYAGKTDANDQHARCRACGKTTWEIVSKTTQELRLGRYEVGKSFTERGD